MALQIYQVLITHDHLRVFHFTAARDKAERGLLLRIFHSRLVLNESKRGRLLFNECRLVPDEAKAFFVALSIFAQTFFPGFLRDGIVACQASSAWSNWHLVWQKLRVLLVSNQLRLIKVLLLWTRVGLLVLHYFSLRRLRVGSSRLLSGPLLYLFLSERRGCAVIKGLRLWLLFHKLEELLLLMLLTYLSVRAVELHVDLLSGDADDALK